MKKILFVLVLLISVASGCMKSESTAPFTDDIVVPNAFTPNNDGLNDVFLVSGTNIRKYEIKIYDQNNLLVYNSKNIKEGWDGTFYNDPDKPMPAGTYSWIIDYEDETGKKQTRTGSVELIRK